MEHSKYGMFPLHGLLINVADLSAEKSEKAWKKVCGSRPEQCVAKGGALGYNALRFTQYLLRKGPAAVFQGETG